MASNHNTVDYQGSQQGYSLAAIGIAVLSVMALALSAYFMGTMQVANRSGHSQVEKYPFLAQRLFEPEHNDLIVNFTQLREVMRSTQKEHGLPVGVYFEYLPTGSSIGVNDQFEVELGSLAKVPAVMATYKNIEDGVISPDTNMTLKPEYLDNQFGSMWQKGAGAKVTVREAIKASLVESDNTAVNALIASIPNASHEAVFERLDLPKTTDGVFPTMSPKGYASIFRSLYLSTYLSYEHSNAILDYLSKTKFTDKLPAGVPSSVKVSHKIGVFNTPETKTTVYNDCGIVYVPQRPYILCIMAATDEATARKETITYSKMVYSFVAQVKAEKPADQE